MNEWKTGRAPWAFEDCPSCKGSGWSGRAGVPCRICSTKAMRSTNDKPSPQLYSTRATKSGVSQFKEKEEGSVNGSVPKDETAPPKESAFANPPQPVDQGETKKDEAKPTEKKTTKKEDSSPDPEGQAVILCIDTAPQKLPEGLEVRYLYDLLASGPVGARIAKDLDGDCFLLSNPFTRRDLVKHYADKICEALKGKVLVINTGNTDERETCGAFRQYASMIFEG